MTVSQIKKAVNQGKTVHWATPNYIVIKDNLGQYLVHSQCNDHYIGLTWSNGVTLNNPGKYYISN